MLTGYCFGKLLYDNERQERKKMLVRLGLGIILFFIIVRIADVYGDPDVLTDTDKPLNSLYSFLEVSKYPPSLLFMCMTIGPALLFMAWFGNAQNRLTKIISVYGRVPFFYYILHFYLLHALATLVFFARGHTTADQVKNAANVIPNFEVK